MDASKIPQITAAPSDERPSVFPAEKLRTFHRNPRVGNTAEIIKSLQANGQYRPIIANVGTFTGRPNEVLAGNHLLRAAMKLKLPTLEVHWVDVDDETANRIVLVDNRSADLGRYDDAELVSLLGDLSDLEGSGYTDDDLAALLDGDEEEDGQKVEFTVKPKKIFVAIDCVDAAERDRTAKALEDLGYTVRLGG